MDVRETLQLLVRLQDLERSIAAVNADFAKAPARIAEIDATLEDAKGGLAKTRAKTLDIAKKRRDLESEVATTRTRISRHQDQMMAVKNNEEYRALSKEIAGENAKISQSEDGILDLMEQAEELAKSVKERELALAAEERRVAVEKSDLEAKGRALASERAGYDKERDVTAGALSAEALAQYRRIANLRAGIALSRLNGETCTECRVRVRPQAAMEARLFQRVVCCDVCSRILHPPSFEPIPAAEARPDPAPQDEA